jgi:hypothetical protein
MYRRSVRVEISHCRAASAREASRSRAISNTSSAPMGIPTGPVFEQVTIGEIATTGDGYWRKFVGFYPNGADFWLEVDPPIGRHFWYWNGACYIGDYLAKVPFGAPLNYGMSAPRRPPRLAPSRPSTPRPESGRPDQCSSRSPGWQSPTQ